MSYKRILNALIFAVLMKSIAMTGCKMSTPTVSISHDVDNDHVIQWETIIPQGNYTLALEDLSSGILAEVGDAVQEYDDVEVKSIKVASFSLISRDVSNFEYLDSSMVFLNVSNPGDPLQGNPSPNGAYLGMMKVAANNNAAINLELTDVELKTFFEDNDQYDLYFEGKINDKLSGYNQNRLVDVELTFRVEMES